MRWSEEGWLGQQFGGGSGSGSVQAKTCDACSKDALVQDATRLHNDDCSSKRRQKTGFVSRFIQACIVNRMQIAERKNLHVNRRRSPPSLQPVLRGLESSAQWRCRADDEGLVA